MEEVYKNIYMEKFPLTGNPLREMNIFAIKTDEGNMIVDTGFNNDENRKNMDDFIEALDLDLSKTKLFLTHLHSDHVGLASYLQDKGISEIYLSRVDGEFLSTGTTKEGYQWQCIINNAHKQGMEPDHLRIEEHPGFKNRPQKMFKYTPVDPGMTIDLGEFHFELLDEAGHTPGMLGLYDRDKKILFCGDHVLGKITPNITFWADKFGDSLGIYLKNITKLKDMDIEHLYSSHRFMVQDVPARVDELLAHHKKRLQETLDILKKYGKATSRDVTVNLNWDIRAKNWDEFPNSQKWFAAGEAASHLVHLINLGYVKEEMQDNGVALYSLVDEDHYILEDE